MVFVRVFVGGWVDGGAVDGDGGKKEREKEK